MIIKFGGKNKLCCYLLNVLENYIDGNITEQIVMQFLEFIEEELEMFRIGG